MERDLGRTFEIAAGIALVLLGGVFLALQYVETDILDLAWPLFVIVPGLLLFVLMFAVGPQSGFLAIPASLITASGLILLVTNTFDAWETWSYAWTLVTPTAVGLGLLIWGAYARSPELRRAGRIVTLVGFLLFVAFGLLFELVFGIGVLGDLGLSRIVFPVLLIVAGLWLMLARGFRRA